MAQKRRQAMLGCAAPLIRHDSNRDGRLTLGEFIRVARWLDARIRTEHCEEAFEVMDESARGKIDFQAFLS
jgi:Ca2+-binding EF-hand superfamily protein